MQNKIINLLLSQGTIDCEDIEIYQYGLFVVIFNIACVLAILLIGLLLNELINTLYYLLFFIPVRIFLGGYHCKTAKSCIFYSSLTFFVLIKLDQAYCLSNLSILITTTMLICILHNLIENANNEKKSNRILISIWLIEFSLLFLTKTFTCSIINAWAMCSGLYIINHIDTFNKKSMA